MNKCHTHTDPKGKVTQEPVYRLNFSGSDDRSIDDSKRQREYFELQPLHSAERGTRPKRERPTTSGTTEEGIAMFSPSIVSSVTHKQLKMPDEIVNGYSAITLLMSIDVLGKPTCNFQANKPIAETFGNPFFDIQTSYQWSELDLNSKFISYA